MNILVINAHWNNRGDESAIRAMTDRLLERYPDSKIKIHSDFNFLQFPLNDKRIENAVIPSNAYLNNFQKDHFVSPATLSTFSYSIHFVSNPTKLNNPFEYLLYSFKEIIASTTCLFINL